MPYVEENLMPGEEVLLRPRYHWVRFVPGGAVAAAGLLLALLAVAFLPPEGAFSPGALLLWLGGAGIVLGLGAAALRALLDSFDEFALTSLRVVKKTGLIRREVRQIPLDKVQDLNIRATLWGRWLAFGDVELQTAGADGTVVFPRILHPEEMRNVLFAHLPRAGRAPLAPVPASVEVRLRELERLKASGLVSEAEFQEKRKALISEL